MLILALDSALARCSATIVADDEVVAGLQEDRQRGHATVLAGMARDVLNAAATAATALDLIAVTVGPGSFTGIRGGLALALGIGVATGVPVIGVTVGEALADSLPSLGRRVLWCAVPSRRGRVFLEIGEEVYSLALADLPRPDLPQPGQPVAVAGSAAMEVAARLAARDVDVMLTDASLPIGRHIAVVAARRFHRQIRPLAAEPLYIDAPQATPAAVRPPPAG